MPSEREKFSRPEAMKQREIAEDFSDYFEEKEEEKDIARAAEREKKAKDMIDAFYAEGLESGEKNPIFHLRDRLVRIPTELRNEVFHQWMVRDPKEVLFRMDEFGTLPSVFQEDIAKYLEENESPEVWLRYQILRCFAKIDNPVLLDYIKKCCDDELFLHALAEKDIGYKKLPYTMCIELLSSYDLDDDHASYVLRTSAEQIIPYIDLFPSITRDEAIQTIFSNDNSFEYDYLIGYRERLGLDVRQIIDLFVNHERAQDLLLSIKYIDSQYHQEIVDKCFEKGYISPILESHNFLKEVDVSALIQKLKKQGVLEVMINSSSVMNVWADKIPQDVLDYMVDKYPEQIAAIADKVQAKVDKKQLIETLLEKEKVFTLLGESEHLGITLDTAFAERILESTGGGGAILTYLNKFSRLPRDIYVRISEKNHMIHCLMTEFDGLTKEDVYYGIMHIPKGFESNAIVERIINSADSFLGLRLDEEFALFLIEQKKFVPLIANLEKFEGLDVVNIGKKVFHDHDGFSLIIENLEKFPGLDHAEVANEALEKGGFDLFFDNFKKFKGLDHKTIASKLIEDGNTGYLADNLDLLSGIHEDRSIGKKLFDDYMSSSAWNVPLMLKIIDVFHLTPDKIFASAADIFGQYLTREIYDKFHEIYAGRVPAETLQFLGITKPGDTGLNQLRARFVRLKTELMTDSFDAKVLMQSELFSAYFKSYVRFSESDWGEHGEKSFKNTINTYLDLQRRGRIRTIPNGYSQSGEISIAKIDQEFQEQFQYSEQFLSRYKTLVSSLGGALALLKEKKPISQLVTKAESKRETIIQELESKLRETTNQKAVESIRKRISQLRELDFRSVKQFQDNFTVLSQFGEFHEELRQLVFYYALHKHKNYREMIDHLVKKESPNFADISSMNNFVGHIVNEETWNKYFTNKQAVKAFSGLVNIRALEEEFARAQNQASKGSVSMEFIPTRGLLMEFSGHIADACWASKYESISQQFPNFSAVIMCQNRGTKHERLAGAAMLIETMAHDGTPLLVIRGLNPIENVINSLSVEDFFEKFTDYAGKIAKTLQRKLAIVIDDHSGGSGTNRPVLFEFLNKKRQALKKVALKSVSDTAFNGYNIKDDSYLIY